MCIAKLCTFPEDGHVRLEPQLCEYVLAQGLPPRTGRYDLDSDTEEDSPFLKWLNVCTDDHPKPALTIQIEKPTFSGSLCSMGLDLKAKPASEPSDPALVVWSKSDLDDYLQEIVYFNVVDPIRESLGDKQLGKVMKKAFGDKRQLGKTTTKIPIVSSEEPKSGLNDLENMRVTGQVRFDCDCDHPVRLSAKPTKISDISKRCQVCKARVRKIQEVVAKDALSRGVSSGGYKKHPDAWDIKIYY